MIRRTVRAAVAGVTVGAFFWIWLHAPVLNRLTLPEWRGVWAFLMVTTAVGFARWTRADYWLSAAAGMGVVVSGALVELARFNDLATPIGIAISTATGMFWMEAVTAVVTFAVVAVARAALVSRV